MKRDMDLVRKILLKIEENDSSDGVVNLEIDGYTMDEIIYHCQMLKDANMISNVNVTYADGGVYYFSVGQLTWDGHDFLDSIRDNSQWKKIKDTAIKHGLPLVIDVIKNVSTALVTSATEGAVKAIINGQ